MNKERLLKLAEHLESGVLGHKEFDFDQFNTGLRGEKGCGTVGCALGECPIVFPKSWKFGGYTKMLPGLKRGKLYTYEAAEKFFGVSGAASQHLFCPSAQNTQEFGGNDLDRNATRHQVAANIRAFVAKGGA